MEPSEQWLQVSKLVGCIAGFFRQKGNINLFHYHSILKLTRPGGVLLGIYGRGVLPASPNPDPISDQKMREWICTMRHSCLHKTLIALVSVERKIHCVNVNHSPTNSINCSLTHSPNQSINQSCTHSINQKPLLEKFY